MLRKKLMTAGRIFREKGFLKLLKVIASRLSKLLFFNMDENRLCWELLSSGSSGIMVDVGAHHGETFQIFLGLGYRVIAFEPDPENRQVLLKKFPMEQHSNLSVDPRAVADRREKRNFYTSSTSSGISSLHSFHQTHKESYSVDTITLKDFFKDESISDLDYLKIDTEGFDLKVLKGIDFEAISPRVILCEFEDNKTTSLNYVWQDMANFLVSKNYHVLVSEWYPIVEYGQEHKFRGLKSYPCDLEDAAGWGNLIALSSASDIEFIQASYERKRKWKF